MSCNCGNEFILITNELIELKETLEEHNRIKRLEICLANDISFDELERLLYPELF